MKRGHQETLKNNLNQVGAKKVINFTKGPRSVQIGGKVNIPPVKKPLLVVGTARIGSSTVGRAPNRLLDGIIGPRSSSVFGASRS